MVYKGVTKEQIDEIFGRVKPIDIMWPNHPPLKKDIPDPPIKLTHCPYCKHVDFIHI